MPLELPRLDFEPPANACQDRMPHCLYQAAAHRALHAALAMDRDCTIGTASMAVLRRRARPGGAAKFLSLLFVNIWRWLIFIFLSCVINLL